MIRNSHIFCEPKKLRFYIFFTVYCRGKCKTATLNLVHCRLSKIKLILQYFFLILWYQGLQKVWFKSERVTFSSSHRIQQILNNLRKLTYIFQHHPIYQLNIVPLFEIPARLSHTTQNDATQYFAVSNYLI